MTVLVCVIMQTRAHELTFKKFKENVIDVLNADLAICVSATPKERLGFGKDPFHIHAKYKYICDEVEDFGTHYDIASLVQFNKKKQDDEKVPDWRIALAVRDQLFGGVKSPPGQYQHPGSAAIMLFFRWFLLQCLEKDSLIDKYDHFIVTRSDQYHELPHVAPSDDYILLPRGEDWYGLTDRHLVVPRKYLKSTLNLLDWILEEPEEVVRELGARHQNWNPESYYLHHLVREGVADRVRRFRRTFYSVRAPDGPTRWSLGDLDSTSGMMIKYPSEKKGVQETKDIDTNNIRNPRPDYGLWGPVDPRAWPPGIVSGFEKRGFRILNEIPYIRGTVTEDFGEAPLAAASLHIPEFPCGGHRWVRKWSRELIDFMVKLAPADLSPAIYPEIAIITDKAFQDMRISGKAVGVLNSASPWAESLAIARGAKRVVSIGRISSPESLDDRISTMTLEEFDSNNTDKLDFIVALTLGRDGLGRDGEEIDPDGDILTLRILAESLAPGGTIMLDLILGEECLTISNLNRVYDRKSLDHLLVSTNLKPIGFCQMPRSLVIMLKSNEEIPKETSFLTYGSEERGYASYAALLSKEALSIGRFGSSSFNTASDLDAEFRKRNADILDEPRGGGYWLWKPYIIFKRLLEMPDDSILVYCDSLYRITGNLSHHVASYFEANPGSYAWLTKNKPGDGTYLESDFTKADALTIVQHRKSLVEQDPDQVWAGCIAFKKCIETMTLVSAWLTYCQDSRVISSGPDVLSPKNSSRDNRHDQTVLSLLAKAAGIPFHDFPASLLVDLRTGVNVNLRNQELSLGHGDIPRDHDFGRVFCMSHNFDHFRALQSIMATTYESWRGCGSYLIDGTNLGYSRSAHGKQCAMYDAAKGKTRFLEIGVHGCHSMLIMLLANPERDIVIEAIDTCIYEHTIPCVEYLQRAFPAATIKLHIGESFGVLENFRSPHSFDLVHIDGTHELKDISAEFRGILPLATSDATIIFEGYETPGLSEAISVTWSDEIEITATPRCSFPNCVTRRRKKY